MGQFLKLGVFIMRSKAFLISFVNGLFMLASPTFADEANCTASSGYPLGNWSVNQSEATSANYTSYITFTTKTSGTWPTSSGKSKFAASPSLIPNQAVIISYQDINYSAQSSLIVSSDGCKMSGTFFDSLGNNGKTFLTWQGSETKPMYVCATQSSYPIGKWMAVQKNATPADYTSYILFTSSTSGTWPTSSGKSTITASPSIAPNQSVVLSFKDTNYNATSSLVVSADGCRMWGRFTDSLGNKGEAEYSWAP